MSDTSTGGRRSRPGIAETQDPIPARIVHKREFIGRVAAQVDAPRAQIRQIVDATLNQLGSAIADGETLALQPFGNARVTRQRTNKGSEVLVLRLRRKAAGKGGGMSEDEIDDDAAD